jgi:ketosteroid isomerase-like protein
MSDSTARGKDGILAALMPDGTQIVRLSVDLADQSRRRFDERIYLRFPALRSIVGRAVWRLPSRSRLRQALIRRAVKLGFEAMNRGDFKAAFSAYDPQLEMITDSKLRALGFDDVYHGVEGRMRFQERWQAEWRDFKYALEEVIDFGDDRLLVSGRLRGSGRSSGAGFETPWAVLVELSAAGSIVREHYWFDRNEALEAVGLRAAA